MPRADARERCGDADNGYGLVINWIQFAPGSHEVRVDRDGIAIGRAQVTITLLDEEFLRGVQARFVLDGFPEAGERTTVAWSQARQNFVIIDP